MLLVLWAIKKVGSIIMQILMAVQVSLVLIRSMAKARPIGFSSDECVVCLIFYFLFIVTILPFLSYRTLSYLYYLIFLSYLYYLILLYSIILYIHETILINTNIILIECMHIIREYKYQQTSPPSPPSPLFPTCSPQHISAS